MTISLHSYFYQNNTIIENRMSIVLQALNAAEERQLHTALATLHTYFAYLATTAAMASNCSSMSFTSLN